MFISGEPVDIFQLLVWAIALVLDKQEQMMATLDDLTADDTELTTEVAQILTLVQTLQAQVAALQNSGLTQAQQALLDAADATVKQVDAQLAAGLQTVNGTPAPPAPVAAPPAATNPDGSPVTPAPAA